MTRPATTPADGELLPCPFCGGDSHARPEEQHEPGCYFIILARLKAAPRGDISLVPELLAAWNRRATPSPGKADAERLAFLIDRGLELIACECEVGPPRMWTLGGMSQPIGWFPTQRAAIDAAIQQERDKQ